MVNKKWAAMTVTLLIFGWAAVFKGGMADYIQELKNSRTNETAFISTAARDGSNELDSLYEQISREAVKRNVAPVNAVVDRVWKAIPGYNGLEVDVEETYRLAKASPQAPIRFQYHEVEPEVKLHDLGVHPVYKGNPNKAMVSFMINVAWGNEFLEPILRTLKDEKVKATFFLDGSWLKKNADLARHIQSEGHELSNHAYSHPDMSRLGRDAAYQQIAKTEALLKSELNVKNKWFAPPSGDYNQTTVQVAAEQGLRTVLWTLDTIDWKKPPAYAIIQKIRLRIEPGTLILMHPTASSSEALPGMIREIRKKRAEYWHSQRNPLREAGARS